MNDVRRQAGALFLFLAGWVPAAGADGVLSGTVKDAFTGAPLADVLVRVWDCRGASVASASTNAAVLTVMPDGAQVALLGETSNGFAKVRYQGIDGWAYAIYLE